MSAAGFSLKTKTRRLWGHLLKQDEASPPSSLPPSGELCIDTHGDAELGRCFAVRVGRRER